MKISLTEEWLAMGLRIYLYLAASFTSYNHTTTNTMYVNVSFICYVYTACFCIHAYQIPLEQM